jgi:hypothetical protein
LIWRFTLVLIKINYGQIGDQTGLFYTTNPVFYTSGNIFLHCTSTFGNLWFFHLSRRTTVIQDLLVRRHFSLVLDNRTNVNVEACQAKYCVHSRFQYRLVQLCFVDILWLYFASLDVALYSPLASIKSFSY